MSRKLYLSGMALLTFAVTGCSTPSDVANSQTIASFSSSGKIPLATYCVRKEKEAAGTIVNSVMNFDTLPTPTGMEMQLYAQGDHRITYAIAYYNENATGYTVDVKATGQQWGAKLAEWVGSCAASGS
ncbi:hypothetical protein [Loktanella sp. M215]|uniref:hypothetical protein n=1 Tax=Loktanella sp. M215 TaxID=2675431 RepID=UPI001F3B5C5B|nr:hypothetical protein [Loktanella sp. M215]MCF7699221.1 hypothetical protein [Loktanella sp. M215]